MALTYLRAGHLCSALPLETGDSLRLGMAGESAKCCLNELLSQGSTPFISTFQGCINI